MLWLTSLQLGQSNPIGPVIIWSRIEKSINRHFEMQIIKDQIWDLGQASFSKTLTRNKWYYGYKPLDVNCLRLCISQPTLILKVCSCLLAPRVHHVPWLHLRRLPGFIPHGTWSALTPQRSAMHHGRLPETLWAACAEHTDLGLLFSRPQIF